MEQRVVQWPQMVLVGLGFFGDPFQVSGGWSEENEIGRLWARFMRYVEQHPGSIRHLKDEQFAYELHVPHDETEATGEYEVFVGMAVERLEAVPVELSIKLLPPNLYAVFSLHGPEIVSDWHKLIYQEQLPLSGFEIAAGYSFQRYDERFKGVDHIDDSELDVFVPIAPRPSPE